MPTAEPRPTVTIRPTFSRVMAAVVVVVCVLVVALSLGEPTRAAQLLGPVGLVGLVAWATFWRPQVEVSDGGVTVVNPARTTHVPWTALESVSTKWTLTLHTTGGATVSAFAAPAATAVGAATRGPDARQVRNDGDRTGLSGEAYRIIDRRRDELAPWLGDAAHGAPGVTVHWHVRTAVAAGALVAAWALTTAAGAA